MIDMVFQLLLFFLVATDFSARTLEDVRLPRARSGIEDTGPDSERIVVNVSGADAPEIRVRGQSMDLPALAEFLRRNGQQHAPKLDPATGLPVVPREGRRTVVIRCDRRQAFAFVQAILQILSAPEVALRDVEIAAEFPRGDGDGR